ncbi:MAG: hypothetical protein LBR56_02945 [Sporomusaceae bacterium]|nr:hypothetical protein [Sporomusaceae bacterium]
MSEIICAVCFQSVPPEVAVCPECGSEIILEGEAKNVIDHIEPNCLIHRYDGSDMLEAAFLLKEAKVNYKVATKLKEYTKPLSVPRDKVFKFDNKIFGAIQALRNERSATMHRYDLMIKNHWNKLKPYQ